MQPLNKNIHAVILAGGTGTRFWPLSRERSPKQMLKIFGEDTMIRQTIKRICGLVSEQNISIVTNERLAFDLNLHLEGIKRRKDDFKIIAESIGRNTAPAIGLAAVYLKKNNPDSIMVVLSSDHSIGNEKAFIDVLKKAIKSAEKGNLVTLGVKPVRPETGYGYIKAGVRNQKSGIRKVEKFTEKPDIKTAQRYLESGNYFWNSGIFVWKVSAILGEIKKYMPLLYSGLLKIEKALATKNERKIIEEVYSELESQSIDYGVLEKSNKVMVAPADIGWCDVGSWTALDDVLPHDDNGNIIKGNVVDIASKDSIIFSSDRLVATIGLKNMVIVDTPDATLVCEKHRAQDVKKIVDELKRRGKEEHLIHKTVERPWGAYTVLECGDRYKIKRLAIKPGGRLSMQLHRHRSEHWVVVSGTARVTKDTEVYDVHPNESTYIPMSTKHRLENIGKVLLQIIEVQNGEYLGEDDIERIDDDYNR
ncbi:MAG: mannose-1-phosphate guanylyltransferase/mannose-6-phosphate isomerase [Deltaproteobacteria bacterium RIFCSPLOWO2_12_FULL_43_16]|nr:MAG: mannose-1-phosphate guanylyltransferase/mannose-6-phosphate isomerase [Deltaproteobacteria bacterium GWA2_43_19]OGQ10981.1 MAG: mannose-1-phosphate guanylyltransferase/mannose-6-phosphate isomerase [Deltaproteobacteria bacterium RIFCSPHIGHO2_02_FULL_43_33]OGQ60121.1 MAG: mannose-1-phosphate guanylyltransferase/mannose-6-phosphate isomerase [Deltaproteobacteria bacterium RIFCSPLOWO2_12_FULL_43_16]